MKKKKPIVLPPLFRKERDMMGIVNNPEKLKKLADVVAQAQTTVDNLKKCDDLRSWMAYTIQLLPQTFEKREEFITKLSELVDEYCNEPERNDTTELG